MRRESMTWDPCDVETQRRYVLVHLLEAAGDELRAAAAADRRGQFLTASKSDTVGLSLLEAAGELQGLELGAGDEDRPCSDLVAWLVAVVGRYRRAADRDSRAHMWHAAEQWDRVAAVLERLPAPLLGLEAAGEVVAD